MINAAKGFFKKILRINHWFNGSILSEKKIFKRAISTKNKKIYETIDFER